MRQVVLAVVCALIVASGSPSHGQATVPTVVYMVRHGETGANGLNAVGRARSRDLAAALKEVRFTHIFSSHTVRTRQMVEPVAASHSLQITQLPQPGSLLNGSRVDESTPTVAAAKPVLDAIGRVPPGSTVLFGGNRENIFAVLNDLGVPLCGRTSPGAPADNCVPCRDSSCWGEWFDRLWIVTLIPGQPVRLVQIHYGTPRP